MFPSLPYRDFDEVCAVDGEPGQQGHHVAGAVDVVSDAGPRQQQQLRGQARRAGEAQQNLSTEAPSCDGGEANIHGVNSRWRVLVRRESRSL